MYPYVFLRPCLLFHSPNHPKGSPSTKLAGSSNYKAKALLFPYYILGGGGGSKVRWRWQELSALPVLTAGFSCKERVKGLPRSVKILGGRMPVNCWRTCYLATASLLTGFRCGYLAKKPQGVIFTGEVTFTLGFKNAKTNWTLRVCLQTGVKFLLKAPSEDTQYSSTAGLLVNKSGLSNQSPLRFHITWCLLPEGIFTVFCLGVTWKRPTKQNLLHTAVIWHHGLRATSLLLGRIFFNLQTGFSTVPDRSWADKTSTHTISTKGITCKLCHFLHVSILDQSCCS